MDHHHQYSSSLHSIDAAGGSDRFPQWSILETRDFLAVRAELDPNFMETKRNKLLWEVISTRMKDKGYSRSAEQCKCKWKNLVTRYKGCETSEGEVMRQQFPFYNELQSIFAARMQRMVWLEAEAGTSSKKKAMSSDEEEENEESEKKKRKVMMKGSIVVKGVREMMEDLMKQQMEVEMQWQKAYEAREQERRGKEMEWRQRMEALENERILMETRWRERDEQRKMRDEARADKRDALITALLNKLTPHQI